MIKFKFDQNGLMPAIIQDYKNDEVLMLAYVNENAIKQMLKIGKTCFYSRSRKTYWIKGETSGHIQQIKTISTDCDRDTLLIQVKQIGGACHLGYRSCFVHQLDSKGKIKKITQKKIFDPQKVY
ncbi:MAG: phosphoribosyl-AMP cyclohydrolase [Candidatus Omnitrophica bacterium]|nr:phosphoribosyl-AMP cyclohydrolase [Candidatus Omnitrophota bacterium]